MALKLKPYPEYKQSGVQWLGKIPAHWSILPNRALFSEVKERNHPGEQLLSVTIGKGVILQKDLLSNTSKKDSSNENKSNYKLVCPRDLAYNKMRAWQGAVGVSDYRGIVSPAYVVIRPRTDCDPRYFNYLFRTPMFAKEAERWSYGITSDQWSLRPEDFRRIHCLIPPIGDQGSIVNIITGIEGRIRRLMRSKRRLINLLNEQKRAIIRHAVTRGLDPNVRLKASGIDWLGEVPAHWEVKRLGHFITLQRGFDITKDQQIGGQIPVVSSGGILSYHNQSTSKGPGVIVGRVGSAGAVHFVESDFWAHNTTLWVKEFNHNHPKFIYYLLQTLELKKFDTGSANPTLNRNIIHPEPVSLPPVNEQRTIASFLDHISRQLDKLVGDTVHQIELLGEYRTRLIADVVTGKLDVTGVKLTETDTEMDFDDDSENGELEIYEDADMDEAVTSDE